MEEVVSVMDKLMPYFNGFDEPIKSDDDSMRKYYYVTIYLFFRRHDFQALRGKA